MPTSSSAAWWTTGLRSALRAGRKLPASSIGQAPDMQDRDDNKALKPQPSRQSAASLAKSAIALRPATPADTEFCYQLHKAAMGEYITAIWGGDEQVQRAFHERAFNPHRWQIITAGLDDIGMLDVDYRPGEI